MSKINEFNYRNACIEIPANIFQQSVELARSINFTKKNPNDVLYWSDWETHPAVKLVCDWWNANAPEDDLRCAGSFHIKVRVDKGKYYTELDPDSRLEAVCNEDDAAEYHARYGDYFLIAFLKNKQDYTVDLGYPEHFYINYVDGFPCCDVWGNTIDLADNAQNTLVDLKYFPERFPVAWRAIIQRETIAKEFDSYKINPLIFKNWKKPKGRTKATLKSRD